LSFEPPLPVGEMWRWVRHIVDAVKSLATAAGLARQWRCNRRLDHAIKSDGHIVAFKTA
jgi:hypothetical protein